MMRLTREQRMCRARRLYRRSLLPQLDLARLLLGTAGVGFLAVAAALVILELAAQEQQFDSANCTMTDMGGVDRTYKEVMINCMRFEWVPIDGAGIMYGRVQKLEGYELGRESQKFVDVGVTGVVLSCKPGAHCPPPGSPAERYARESAEQVRKLREVSRK